MAVATGAQAIELVVTADPAAAEIHVTAGIAVVEIEREQAQYRATLPAVVLAEVFRVAVTADVQVAEFEQAAPGHLAGTQRLARLGHRRVRITGPRGCEGGSSAWWGREWS